MPEPEFLTGTHYGKMFKTFLNAYNTYFKLTGISDKKTKALFAKTCLAETARTWYDSQGYNKTLVTFATMKSHILDYSIPYDYIKRTRRALVACKIGE